MSHRFRCLIYLNTELWEKFSNWKLGGSIVFTTWNWHCYTKTTRFTTNLLSIRWQRSSIGWTRYFFLLVFFFLNSNNAINTTFTFNSQELLISKNGENFCTQKTRYSVTSMTFVLKLRRKQTVWRVRTKEFVQNRSAWKFTRRAS